MLAQSCLWIGVHVRTTCRANAQRLYILPHYDVRGMLWSCEDPKATPRVCPHTLSGGSHPLLSKRNVIFETSNCISTCHLAVFCFITGDMRQHCPTYRTVEPVWQHERDKEAILV